MSLKTAFSLFVLLASAFAAPTKEHHVIHERRDVLSSAWVKRDRLSGERYLPMRIGLTQTELENAEYHLMSISNPASPDYGKHWDREKVIETFRPSQEAESQVYQWLLDHGIKSERIFHSNDKAWFMFHALVAEAESLLSTEFHEYEHVSTGDMVPSCELYHVPKHVSPHVDYITPGINLPVPGNKKRQILAAEASQRSTLQHRDHSAAVPMYNASDLSLCWYEVTPNCIAALYGIPETSGTPNPDNAMGVVETLLQFYVQSDLDTFFTNYTNIPNGTHPIAANIDGGVQTVDDLGYAGDEVTLDLQMAYPILYPQSIVNYQVDDIVYQTGFAPVPQGPYDWDSLLDALDGSYCTFSAYNQTGNGPSDPIYPDPNGGWQGEQECGTQTATNVISISYGSQEIDLYLSYQKRECLEWLKLGLQGVSVLVASGDSGPAGYPPEFAGLATPGCLGPNQDIFNPTFPASCPWITTVGATRLYPDQSVQDPESVMNRPGYAGHPLNASSGGGFSNVYPMPDYQKTAVDDYFAAHDPGYPYYSQLAQDTGNITQTLDINVLAGNNSGRYNRLGRGYPDVSAVGQSAAIFVGGKYVRVLGTSMSTPIFAAIINRINEERLNAGKKVLGFLNPSLYANPSMLNDITNGTSLGCKNGSEIGFTAVPGWDPATGLGTPNYTMMLDYYMGLP